MGGASVVLGGSHQILDGHVFGLGMTNYTIKKSYTIRFPTMNSEKTLQAKKKQYIYIYMPTGALKTPVEMVKPRTRYHGHHDGQAHVSQRSP